MKRVLFLLAATLMLTELSAQELPVPSPYAEVHQRVGLTDFTIEYSRPGVKGREIFGGLESYGEVWRTGANSATKIEISTTAMLGGQGIEAGTYSIFTVPGKDSWKFMLNSDINASENSYSAEKNVLEIELKPKKIDPRESLLFYFDNIKDESADLIFEWADVSWTIPIKVKAKDQALDNIKNKIAELEKNYRVYNSSARYYLDNKLDLEQALTWSTKSVEIEAKFWNVYTLSLIHHAMGNKKEAINTAQRSLKLAKEAEYMPYVRMNEENIEKWSK